MHNYELDYNNDMHKLKCKAINYFGTNWNYLKIINYIYIKNEKEDMLLANLISPQKSPKLFQMLIWKTYLDLS